MSTSLSSSVHVDRAAGGCASRPGRAASPSLSSRELSLIAARFRLLSHPVRLRLLRDLHAADGTVLDLAAPSPDSLGAVRSHLSALHRAGLVCRTDAGGPAVFSLVSWADWWLVEQYAAQLRRGPERRLPDRRVRR